MGTLDTIVSKEVMLSN
jgi:hypothetical protein